MEAEARVLQHLGHEVVIATPPFKQLPLWKAQLTEQGLEHVVWSPYKMFERMHLAWPIRRLVLATAPRVHALNIDLAVICVPWNFIGMSMAYVLRDLRIPYVLAVHCKLGVQTLNERANRLLRDTLLGCAGAYGVSAPVTDSFKRLYGDLLAQATHTQTVMNGVDVIRFSPDLHERNRVRQELLLEPDARVVIFCGRLDPLKRPTLAVKAFLGLRAVEPRARLLVVGAGSSEAEMRELFDRASQAASVRFLGQVTDTARYFRAGDCYLSTSSSFEGFSLTAAEALGTGLPIVVPDDEVFRSVYGGCDDARFCAGDDPTIWAHALRHALGPPVSSTKTSKASSREYASNFLSLPVMENALRGFYVEVSRGLANSSASLDQVSVGR